jgi:hypothetical protein
MEVFVHDSSSVEHFRALRIRAMRSGKTSVTCRSGSAGVDQKITDPNPGKVQKENKS